MTNFSAGYDMSGSVVAIVGGGFCGVLSAVRLLELGGDCIKKIVLIEKQARVGRGVAYGTSDDSHLLNVSAGQMSAFAEDPQHFLRFANEADATISSGDFVPRKLYGQYIESILDTAVRNAATSMEFVRLTDCAIDIQTARDGRVAVMVANGDVIAADQVIIASGNLSSRNPFGQRHGNTLHAGRYINNPWATHALDRIDFAQPVLLLGAGLTAVDMTCSLTRQGFTNTIYMISRHGLKAAAHAACNNVLPAPDKQFLSSLRSMRSGLRALREQVKHAAQQGHDWREVLACLRQHTPTIWQELPHDERRRFLRHLQRYWDIHRHRLPPSVAQLIERLTVSGQLQQYAGRVAALTASGDHFHIDIELRHSQSTLTLRAGRIVNCMGMCTNLDRIDDSLIANLHRRGLCTADDLSLGIACDDHYALIDAKGQPSTNIFYVGPYLRAQFWEATAVPELRVHVTNLVRKLVEQQPLLRTSEREMRIRA
jgi:uncharacterized NAD(P)/FAD-binding protein YdhS